MKAILFDCDGTVADSCAMICEIMRMVFVKHGLEVPLDSQTRAIIGLSLDTAIGQLKPDANVEDIGRMAETYRTIFRGARSDAKFREALFPGMKALVRDLAARENVCVGMVTGKSRRGVDAICETHGMTNWFAVVRTADDCASKPDPAMVLESCSVLGLSPADALVVGDSIYDMQMAKAAGASALGVEWGTFAPPALLAAGAFAVARTVEELGAAIDGWLAGDAGGSAAAEGKAGAVASSGPVAG